MTKTKRGYYFPRWLYKEYQEAHPKFVNGLLMGWMFCNKKHLGTLKKFHNTGTIPRWLGLMLSGQVDN